MVVKTIKEKIKDAFENLKDSGYKNKMEVPKIEKVVINVGVGSTRSNKKKMELIADRLAKITGQKPAPRSAKQSIASFKVREGDTVGYQVTLRGGKMYSFLEKLIHIAFPRTKDFRGVPTSGIDEMGNFTVGIKEHTIFPETSDEEISNVFGMSVSIVTSAKDKEEARKFLEYIGIPFAKN